MCASAARGSLPAPVPRQRALRPHRRGRRRSAAGPLPRRGRRPARASPLRVAARVPEYARVRLLRRPCALREACGRGAAAVPLPEAPLVTLAGRRCPAVVSAASVSVCLALRRARASPGRRGPPRLRRRVPPAKPLASAALLLPSGLLLRLREPEPRPRPPVEPDGGPQPPRGERGAGKAGGARASPGRGGRKRAVPGSEGVGVSACRQRGAAAGEGRDEPRRLEAGRSGPEGERGGKDAVSGGGGAAGASGERRGAFGVGEGGLPGPSSRASGLRRSSPLSLGSAKRGRASGRSGLVRGAGWRTAAAAAAAAPLSPPRFFSPSSPAEERGGEPAGWGSGLRRRPPTPTFGWRARPPRRAVSRASGGRPEPRPSCRVWRRATEGNPGSRARRP